MDTPSSSDSCGHDQSVHEKRLNSICRVCGEKSITSRTKSAHIYNCVNHQKLIETCYQIDITSDIDLFHSRTMCRKCFDKMRHFNSGFISEQAVLGLREKSLSLSSIWTGFDSNLKMTDCKSCMHFESMAKPGRPTEKRGKKKPFQNQSPVFPPHQDISEVSDMNQTLPFSTTTSDIDGVGFVQDLSSSSLLDDDLPKTSDINITLPLSTSTPIKTKPVLVDTMTSPIKGEGLWTPSPKRRKTQDSSVSPHHSKTDMGTSPHAKHLDVRQPKEIVAPLTKDEQACQTALNRESLKASKDSSIYCKTGGQPLIFVHVPRPRKSTTEASERTIRRRTAKLCHTRSQVSGGTEADKQAQMAHELKRQARRKKLSQILEKAGHTQSVAVTKILGLALKTHLGLSWSKYRDLKRIMRSIGVKHESEQKERLLRAEAVIGQIKVEEHSVNFRNPTTGDDECRTEPVGYIDDLTDFVPKLIDQYKKANQLTWHKNIPDDEIWVKIGADHGGDSFKIFLQIANIKKPNSKHNTQLICICKCKDTFENMKIVINPMREQLQTLQNMTYRYSDTEEKKIRLWLFGDYDYLIKTFGLSGAAAVHPCLWCTSTRSNNQLPPNKRRQFSQRTLKQIKRDLKKWHKAGSDKKKAKYFNNVIHKAFLGFDICQVVPPYLHLLLGIVKKHHTLLEAECHELDMKIGKKLSESNDEEPQNLGSQSFNKYIQQIRDGDRNPELKYLSGPIAMGLDKALKKHRIYTQAYHGRSFVGNHCNRYLKDDTIHSVCDSVLRNTVRLTDDHELHAEADDICSTYTTLNQLYADIHILVSHTRPITSESTFEEIGDNIRRYMHFFRETFPSTRITPKQHILEYHCLDFMKKTGFGLGLLGEQGGEGCHATVNLLKSRTFGLQSEAEKIKFIMTEHQALVSPLLQLPYLMKTRKRQTKRV